MNLTQKQERYAQNLFAGMTQRDAYRDAYHASYSLPTIDANASRLARNVKIVARRKELNDKVLAKLEEETVMSVGERKVRLTEIARAPLKKYYDPVRAIAELNKMEGEYVPEKHEVLTEVIHRMVFILPDGTEVTPKELSSGNNS